MSQTPTATYNVNGSGVGTALRTLLMADEIEPGSSAGYQLCKTLYTYHPLGAKMAESPIRMAQSQAREISLSSLPGVEARLRQQFLDQWAKDACDRHIFNTARLSRVYGIATLAIVSEDLKPTEPLPMDKLWNLSFSYNVLDPLNTAGSLVLNQIPTSADFQKVTQVTVNGVTYARNRCVVLMNEDPIYLEYTSSGFGYVGRSVYQRALFPMKSFIQSMITDDMVTRKAGLIVAKLKSPGSIIDNVMLAFAGMKRALLKEAATNNVLSIDKDEEITAIDLTNVDAAHDGARNHVLTNIAVAADMPAAILKEETLASGFGEGTEDAKRIARYVDRVRIDIQPLYDFLDPIIMRRAWNPDFYAIIQKEFPDEYASMDYQTAFYNWSNAFKAIWPSLLTEPDSEKVQVDDVKLRAVIAAVEVLMPHLDPENKVKTIEWMADGFNDLELMFGSRLELDFQALADYEPPKPEGADGDGEAKNFAPRGDSLSELDRAVHRIVGRKNQVVPIKRAG